MALTARTAREAMMVNFIFSKKRFLMQEFHLLTRFYNQQGVQEDQRAQR